MMRIDPIQSRYLRRLLRAVLLSLLVLCAPAWGAVAFISANSVSPGQTTSLTLNTMSPAAGELMLAQVSVRGGTTVAITAPAGWTLLDRIDDEGTQGQAVYYRVSSGAEPATYTWRFSSNPYAAGGILVYSGVDTTNPVDVWSKRRNGSSGSVTLNSVTTTVAGAMLVGLITNADGRSNFNSPAGMSERYDTQFGTGKDNAIAVTTFDAIQALPGASGNKVASTTQSVVSIGHLVALRPISGVVTPGGFNAFETSTAPGATTGVIHTKVAGQAFSLAVVALNASGTAVETGFAGDVKLELVDAAAGSSCAGYTAIRTLGTLTFATTDLGRKTYSGFNEPEAWSNVRVRISYPATGAASVVACSTDNFAIRPAAFASVVVSDADSVTAGTARALSNTAANGGVVHKAGQPFRIAATAVNAAGTTTGNYAGTPTASVTGCVLPASGCSVGTLSSGTWTSASGAITATSATYTEAGVFQTQLADASFAAVDAADGSTATERTIESSVITVGRFVPDHFDLATSSTPQFKTFNDTTCAARSFTYIGQPFGYVTLPQATITAKNAAGATTTNYAGTLWKLSAADATQTYAAVIGTLDTGLVGLPTLVPTAAVPGTGTLTANTADVIAFVRSTPVAPFAASINLSMGVSDASENSVPGNGTINTSTPALFSSIAFDAGNQIRFGRLALTNAHGSELLALPVPIQTQYWNGAAFALNVADNCTQLAAGNVALSNWQRSLAGCQTSVTLSGRFASGRGNLRLGAPGAGHSGSVDLTLNLGAVGSGSTCIANAPSAVTGAAQIWLQGNWSGGAAYTQNPAARASFGLYRDSKALIYLREIY